MNLAKRSHGKICEFSGAFTCTTVKRHFVSQIDLPPTACSIHDCSHCIITSQTFILSKENYLLEPSTFILRQLDDEVDENSTSYECLTENGKSCECEDDACSGTKDFCKIRNCSITSTCSCMFTHRKTQLLAITAEETIYNPRLLTIEICLFDNRTRLSHGSHLRKLLEGETATFHQHNFTIKFEDPILTLPDVGRVILRNSEYEHIFVVPVDKMIKIPFELLAFKTEITVIYLHTSGITVTGLIRISGKTVCQLRQCFLCWDVINHFKCFPAMLRYFIYAVFTTVILIILMLIKTVLKSSIFVFKFTFLLGFMLIKSFKLIARCSLLLGAFIGNVMREVLVNFYTHLEAHAVRRPHVPVSIPFVLLACALIITSADADCSTHAIINSELKTCDTLQDGSKVCQLYTTAEISLQNLGSESCLWFTDKSDNHLFSLAVRLEAVTCNFHTERQYFTFPVTAHYISQVSCIFNKYCGRGVHCIKRHVGQGGINFEAETEQSRQFPGVSGCIGGNLGTGCIALRQSCNFFRVWYQPELLQSYEVSKITGHTCKYHVALRFSENNTISRLTITDSAYTKNGIRVSILGAFDQPQLHLQDYFIQRVGRPSEAYLAPASHRNFPKAGEIGAVQANSSFTKNFIFDPNMSTCDYFEDTLRCITAPDALHQLSGSQEHALPLQRDIHLFKIDEDMLSSSLLISAAVRVQLHFTNYKIAVKSNTVCPKFDDAEMSATGCYDCRVLARITFKARSTCDQGVATVHFQEIALHTKAIQLTSESILHTVKFFAETRCYNEKICLKSTSLVQCQQIKFCLEEPSVELLQLNTNYTQISNSVQPNSWTDWFQFPNIGSSLFYVKLIGSSLFILCVMITIFSTLITCCCRSR